MIELLVAQPVNSEAELRRLYPLPVLARVPEDETAAGAGFERPLGDAPRSVREGFRALRDQLELRLAAGGEDAGARQGSTVLMVSAERNDLRGRCSLDLARAFLSIHGVVSVVELDVRDPKMAAMLGIDPLGDLSSLLSGAAVSAIATPFDNGNLLIAAPRVVADLATHEEITARSPAFVDEARRLGDWVVIDAPPIADAAADAVAALDAADFVVVVVHLGSTRPEELGLLRELFEQRGRQPDGYLVVSGSSMGARRSAAPS
jgi:Mrp family chromosome partitioning ATPase